jgi:ribosome-binding protein aMBF1 (putative translation factor)
MKEKFQTLVAPEKTKTYQRIKDRVANKPHLEISQAIAIKVLEKLDKLGWSQKELALKKGVSPQQISKIVRGTENLILESLVKIEKVLGIQLLVVM